MSDRLKELWRQCDPICYMTTDSTMGLSPGEKQLLAIEEFGKMIIRVCAEIALREDHEPSECILSHFGLLNK